VPVVQLEDMTRDVAKEKPDAITIFCTNLRGAPLVEELEREVGIPIYDTISTVVWKSIRQAGSDPSRIRNWGSLFRDVV
jgi:maleate isomerase